MSGSPLTPREPLCPFFPSGGLRSEPLHQKAGRPDNWCQSVDPPRMSISTPRAIEVAPRQDPATLCSTVTSPQQLDQGPIIRKLSCDRNEEQILHLILANRVQMHSPYTAILLFKKGLIGRKEFGIFARRAMVDQAREGLCYQ